MNMKIKRAVHAAMTIVLALSGVLPASAATQNSWRWRNDDGSETAATWSAAENTAVSNFTVGETKRLRFGVAGDAGEGDLTIVATLAGFGQLTANCLDTEAGFEYLSDSATPPNLTRVDLSDFSTTVTKTLTAGTLDGVNVPAGIGNVRECAIDRDTNAVYYVSRSTPAYVVKMSLTDFSYLGSLMLPINQANGVLKDGGYIYVNSYVNATTITTMAKVRLSDFSVVTSMDFTGNSCGVFLPLLTESGTAYYGSRCPTAGSTGRVLKVNLTTMTVSDSLTLTTGSSLTATSGDVIGTGVDVGDGKIYVTCWGSPNRLVAIDKSTFTQTGAYDVAGTTGLASIMLDGKNGLIYYSGADLLVKFDLNTMAVVPGSIPYGDAAGRRPRLDLGRGYIYASAFKNPGFVFKASVATHRDLRLEAAPKVTSCAAATGWQQVTAGSSPFKLTTSTYVADAAVTSNVSSGVTDGSTGFIPGRIVTNASSTGSIGLAEGLFSEVEFAVTPTYGVTDSASYCFRVTDGGTPLSTYSSVAEAQVAAHNGATLQNSVTLSRSKAGSASVSVAAQFTLPAAASTPLTITFPAGFTVTKAFDTGTCSGGGTIGTFAFSGTTLTAAKSSCSGTVTLSGAEVTLPSTAGVYTISWVNDSPGWGTVYVTGADQIDVSATVDPSIAFEVGARSDCNGSFSADDWTVDFGRLNTGRLVASSGDSSVQLICTRVSTNANGGAVVTVRNQNGAQGLKSASTPADRIPNAAAAITSGTPNYGMCYSSVSGDSGQDAGLTPAATAPSATSGSYSVGSCTGALGESVGSLSTSPTEVWRVPGVTSGAFAALRLKVAISATQPAHNDYSDALTFVATATF
jgi:hypothetical protein